MLLKPEELKDAIEKGSLQIGPYDQLNDKILPLDDYSCIQPIGYDVRVGNEVWLWSAQEFIDPEKEALIIRPGEVAVIRTYEYMKVPRDMAGIVKSKVSLVSIGLSHVSTTVDPTFKGYLAVTVSNVGVRDIRLKYKDPFATVVFFRLSSETLVPEFSRPHQNLKSLMQVFFTQAGFDALVKKPKRPEETTLEALEREALWRGKPFDTIYYLLKKQEDDLSNFKTELARRVLPQEVVMMLRTAALFVFPLLGLLLWVLIYLSLNLTGQQLTAVSITITVISSMLTLAVYLFQRRK
jgi:deoxycytidine triphosphate deaminase